MFGIGEEYDPEETKFNDVFGEILLGALKRLIPTRTTRALLAAALLLSPTARAEDDHPERSDFERELIRDNIAISRYFDGIAEGLDLFLAGKRLTNRKNETSVRVDNSTYALDGGGVTNSFGVGVNLRLPNLEEYWHLKFSSYDEKEESRGVQRGYLRQTPRETNYGATVGLFRKLGDIKTTFEPRIELQDPLKISHSLEFESVAKMAGYEVNPKLEFFASPTKGTGTFTALNFHVPLNEDFALTFVNEGEYQDKTHTFGGTNGISLGQSINDWNSMSYDFFLFSHNRDVYHLESYSASVSWWHLIYKKILDFRLTPHVDFTRDRDFTGQAGLVFVLSTNF